MFDLSAWGPNLLKLEPECVASAPVPDVREQRENHDRRKTGGPGKQADAKGAALDSGKEITITMHQLWQS